MDKMKEENKDLQEALTTAQLKKITLEIKNIEKTNWQSRFIQYIPLFTTLIAVGGFAFGIVQFRVQQKERLEVQKIQSQKENEAKEREFKKALWEKQLGYYLEAAKAAATLASFNENDGDDIQLERTKARIRFWQLYYGELAVIEDQNVSRAMVKYGRCLRDYDVKLACDQNGLKEHARTLAQECRNAVAKSWNEPLGQVDRP